MKSATAAGVLDDGAVRVDDVAHANRLHNKGWLGTPLAGNRLKLHLVEAAYAIRQGRLQVTGAQWMDLLGDRELEVQALAFTDLRDRGLVVRPDAEPEGAKLGRFLVWKRGETPKDAPWFRFYPRSERSPVTVAQLATWSAEGAVVGVVDDDGVVTHYQMGNADPQGNVADLTFNVPAKLLGDRWLVSDASTVGQLAKVGMGTPYGDARVLSLLDGALLGKRLKASREQLETATKAQPDLPVRLPVAEDLSARGVLVRSGFRFGAHLRGYSAEADAVHAEWLLHCGEASESLGWSDIARAVRLAHGVRKQHIVAVASASVQYVQVSWFRP